MAGQSIANRIFWPRSRGCRVVNLTSRLLISSVLPAPTAKTRLPFTHW
jgi:hypothetical protein